MKITNNTLILEPTDCRTCAHQHPKGTMPAVGDCPTCNGTGRGPRGGKGGCRTCHGTKIAVSHTERIVCPSCDGNYAGADTERITDYITKELWQHLPWSVKRHDGERFSALASVIGFRNALVTVTDYGRAMRSTDDEILADARHSAGFTQATKLVADRETMRLYDEIVVLVTENGYAVVPQTLVYA